jgi:pimeloyl-ACP methyl ester carboxylesterase
MPGLVPGIHACCSCLDKDVDGRDKPGHDAGKAIAQQSPQAVRETSMPFMTVRGAELYYEVLGERGPWLALTPGGRRGLDEVQSLGERMAAAGYRVLLHDRRNCGRSDIAIGSEGSEYDLWADDLHALLGRLGALPAIVGGSSSGCRTAILMALRHPEAVRALLLWRVTGGRFAAERLAENYYGQFMTLAGDGGMAAVAAAEHFAERIEAKPENRDRLLAMEPAAFIAAMDRWRDYFLQGAELPIIGASEADLRSIRVPAIIIPGNDRTHAHAPAETAHRLIAESELFDLYPGDRDEDLIPAEAWAGTEAQMADLFADFLRRRLGPPAA